MIENIPKEGKYTDKRQHNDAGIEKSPLRNVLHGRLDSRLNSQKKGCLYAADILKWYIVFRINLP